MSSIIVVEGDPEASPLYRIRMALADEEPHLAILLRAAQYRVNGNGKPVTSTALFNAERNGVEVRTHTVLEWAQAWKCRVFIDTFAGEAVGPSFALASLPDYVTWRAMAAMVAAMSFKMKLRLER